MVLTSRSLPILPFLQRNPLLSMLKPLQRKRLSKQCARSRKSRVVLLTIIIPSRRNNTIISHDPNYKDQPSVLWDARKRQRKEFDNAMLSQTGDGEIYT
jgi:hypothetical protein